MYNVWFCTGYGKPNSVFEYNCNLCKAHKPKHVDKVHHIIEGGFGS